MIETIFLVLILLIFMSITFKKFNPRIDYIHNTESKKLIIWYNNDKKERKQKTIFKLKA